MIMYGGAERSAGTLGFLSTLKFVWNMGLVVPIFLMMRSQSLIGLNMLRMAERDPATLGRCLKEVVVAASDGWLKPRVHVELPADRLPEAHAILEAGRSMGKVALRW
jgi:NADPH2:quinone reductase